MNDELFNLWIQRAAMPRYRLTSLTASWTPFAENRCRPRRASWFCWQSSPAVRVAACILACLACLYRMVAVVAVFFVQ